MNTVSREEWNAREPRDRWMNDWPNGVDLWVHHTSGGQDQTLAQIQNYHMDTKGWNDIAYNWLVNYQGTTFEGRGMNVHGAHSPGKNHEPSVCLIGNYVKTTPSLLQHRAVWELRESIAAGRLRGHRENTATTCPGDAAYQDLVKSIPPPSMELTRFYYFEELPHDQGGAGPKIVGQVTGYKLSVRAQAVAKDQKALGRAVSLLREGDGEEGRSFVMWWAPDTYGKPYRWGPWIDKSARDIKMEARQVNTGRTMRKFENRSRSSYPWPDA